MATAPLDHREARATLAVVFAATILIGPGATMLSVALPTVVSDLGAAPLMGLWMLLAYLVVGPTSPGSPSRRSRDRSSAAS